MAPKKRKEPRANLREITSLALFASLWRRSKEHWLILLHHPDFEESAKQARKELGVPEKLSSEDDAYAHWVYVEDGDVDLVESHWVDSLDSEHREAVNDAVTSLLHEFGLTIDFDDRVLYYILYGKPPANWIAPLGGEHLTQVAFDPSELQRIPLTIAEQKLVTRLFRLEHGMGNGRPLKKNVENLARLRELLSSAKSRTRRSRTLKGAIASITLSEQHYSDKTTGGRQIEKRKTYLDLVGELTPIERTENTPTVADDRRVAAKLRAQKSRFLKRGRLAKKVKK